MTHNRLIFKSVRSINEAGRNGAGNTTTALTETRTVGGSAMTADADQYTDSAGSGNREQSDNWKSIGELARKIVEGK